MSFTTLEIRKRSTVRTLQVPAQDENSWRRLDLSPNKFRFHSDRTEYRKGKLTIVFDLDGKPIEGWSYWTCIYCYTEPTEDFPQGRLIYNGSGYGSTTGKHIHEMMSFFTSPAGTYTGPVMRREYRRIDKVIRVDHHKAHTYTNWEGREVTQAAWDHKITRPTRAYTSKLVRHATPGDTEIEQICWGRGTQPSDMREKVRRDSLTRAQREAEDAAIEAARAEREARWAAQQAAWQAEYDRECAALEARKAFTVIAGGA